MGPCVRRDDRKKQTLMVRGAQAAHSQTLAAGGLARLLASEFLLAAVNCFRLRQETTADKSLALAMTMVSQCLKKSDHRNHPRRPCERRDPYSVSSRSSKEADALFYN
jgi:hypothetical protein